MFEISTRNLLNDKMTANNKKSNNQIIFAQNIPPRSHHKGHWLVSLTTPDANISRNTSQRIKYKDMLSAGDEPTNGRGAKRMQSAPDSIRSVSHWNHRKTSPTCKIH